MATLLWPCPQAKPPGKQAGGSNPAAPSGPHLLLPGALQPPEPPITPHHSVAASAIPVRSSLSTYLPAAVTHPTLISFLQAAGRVFSCSSQQPGPLILLALGPCCSKLPLPLAISLYERDPGLWCVTCVFMCAPSPRQEDTGHQGF
jgi:hypothetical protein